MTTVNGALRGLEEGIGDSKQFLPKEVWLTRCRDRFKERGNLSLHEAALFAISCYANADPADTPEDAAEFAMESWTDADGQSHP